MIYEDKGLNFYAYLFPAIIYASSILIIITLIFPTTFIALEKKYRVVASLISSLVIFAGIVITFLAAFGLYSKSNNSLLDFPLILLPMIPFYIIIFLISTYIQKMWGIKKASNKLAIMHSIIISPALFSYILNLLIKN